MPRRRVCLATLASLGLVGCGNSSYVNGLATGSPWPLHELAELDMPVSRVPGQGPALINFWATWCPPCRAEMASLNRIYLTYRDRGLTVDAVAIDEDIHLVREYLRQLPLAIAILLDPGAVRSKRDFLVSVFPTTFLVDEKGLIRRVWVGERDWDTSEMRHEVSEILSA